jgi:hypothetical protein
MGVGHARRLVNASVAIMVGLHAKMHVAQEPVLWTVLEDVVYANLLQAFVSVQRLS